LPYDTVRDFSPVTLIATATILLAVHPSIPARNVKELIALAKRQPGALSFASSGNGGISHLIGEHFKAAGGIQMLHVPYKGDTPALVDLVSGQVSLMFGTAVSFLPYVKAGKLNALAVTNPKRSPIVPNVPTVAQIAKTDEQRLLLKFGTSTPNAFGKVYVVPPGTPVDRAAALESAFEKVFADKELQADAAKGKLEIDPTFGEEIHKLVAEFLGMSPELKNKLQTALKGGKK